MDQILHPFPPVYDAGSRVLVLGTFPSVKSREGEFYYHHPRNRFWKVISEILGEALPTTIEEKKQLLLNGKIAVWDVIHRCEITGSSDSSIRNVVVNDITSLLKETQIHEIFANGNTAYQLYMKYINPMTERDIIKLPSTSPANAACSLELLISRWSRLREALEDTKG